MTNTEIKLNAWEVNYESQIAVQGEVNSRTLSVTLIDKAGTETYISNADNIDRPVDLTGATARLYVLKSDGTKTFSDGAVTDAPNGKVNFTLPYQATTASGIAECQILLTKQDNSTLKTVGLKLDIQPSDLEGAIESTDEFSSLIIALNGVQSALDNAQQAVNLANTAIDGANTAAGAANTATTNANSAAIAAKNLPYIGEDHYWYTYNTTTGQYEKTATQASTQYATFGVNPSTGNLEMYTTDTYSGANFNVNDNGELEVVI